MSRPVGAETRPGTSEAWRTAHRRLYEHLSATTLDKPDATLEDLQPLFQAVVHGCHAGLQQAAFDKIYAARILRQNECFSLHRLGAFGSDLGAVVCFFQEHWTRIPSSLSKRATTSLLAIAAFALRAVGRLSEATQPMRATVELTAENEDWGDAAKSMVKICGMYATANWIQEVLNE